ncbi:hypothetical protein M3182_06115 [Mesobacillus maritimus]|uniref:hypothetical protein n=1 Tax=Mesobacillus maritimus TaxID=1643336 RepID=UPI0020414600|nr:hypothetical protein [Mesobacillus maritimus]MCM3585318.1 hypothetical protein [Mesobacillus maritimus]MCM3668199.1 hypothetical protein [Mesobacillus maritimus]
MISKRKVKKYPYLLLGIIHLTMVFFTFYKSKNRKRSFILFLSYTGFAYLFEYFVVILNRGYVYRPKFMKEKNLDHILGSIWSQFFYVPTTALFISTFRFGWKVKVFFSFYFFCIERLFISMGIFKTRWWKTGYTFLLILVSFFANDLWVKLFNQRNPVVLWITFFQTIQVTWMNTSFLFAAMKKVRYGPRAIRSWEKHFIVGPAVGMFISLLITWQLRRDGIGGKIRSFLLMLFVDSLLIKQGQLKVKKGFFLPVSYSLILATGNLFQRWIYRHQK